VALLPDASKRDALVEVHKQRLEARALRKEKKKQRKQATTQQTTAPTTTTTSSTTSSSKLTPAATQTPATTATPSSSSSTQPITPAEFPPLAGTSLPAKALPRESKAAPVAKTNAELFPPLPASSKKKKPLPPALPKSSNNGQTLAAIVSKKTKKQTPEQQAATLASQINKSKTYKASNSDFPPLAGFNTNSLLSNSGMGYGLDDYTVDNWEEYSEADNELAPPPLASISIPLTSNGSRSDGFYHSF